MNTVHTKKTYSIRTRVVSAFLLFTVFQSLLFFALIYMTGILNIIYDQSYSSLNSQITSRANNLSEIMNNAKSGFIPVARQINRGISDSGSEKGTEMLEASAEYLIEYLNATKEVSGVFVILDNENKNDSGINDCLYIRDSNYGGHIRGTDSKIYVCGPSSIAKKYNYQLYIFWDTMLDLGLLEKNGSADFYNKPMIAAKSFSAAYNDLFYWSRPFKLNMDNHSIITFSLPLVDDNNKPYGVCGFEISEDFLKNMLPYNELTGSHSMYVLNDSKLNSSSGISSGAVSEQLFYADAVETTIIDNESNPIRAINKKTNLPALIGFEKKLKIYNSTSVYKDDAWSLFGFTDEDVLSQYPESLINYLVMAQVIVLLLSAVYIITITMKITHPIKKLSEIVRSIDIDERIALPVTYIGEIDELTNAVMMMNSSAVASASRLNTIIDIAGVSIGGFETRPNPGSESTVLLTNSMPILIGIENKIKHISKSEWDGILEKLGLFNNNDVCRVEDKRTGEERWLRLKKADNNGGKLYESGVIMDVSNEIMELKKTQYERDYDSLTQLLNRRAFLDAVNEGMSNKAYAASAVIMIDLDNLKYINDNYGHDIGDLYIIKTAQVLKEFEKLGGLVSRMAGDEFTVFVPCKANERKELLSLKTEIIQLLDYGKLKNIDLPTGEKQRLRFSAGIAWFPKDADNIELLMKYADFAMYEVKHNIKGTIGEFDSELYKRKSFLINNVETLDLLIEREGFRYMLQPIIDGKTGGVFAYEMLLRSDADGLRTPAEILSIAKSQSKLYFIELIGLKNLFGLIAGNESILKDKLIFYNTVNSVILNNDDWDNIMKKYKRFTDMVVVEITESGFIDEELYEKRNDIMRQYGFKTALDDFGSGSSNETLLVKLNPHYVKIGISLIRDINLSINKQALVKNLVEYCKERDIKIIAFGIETYEELIIVRKLGIELYQGFYLARPSYEIADIPKSIKKLLLEPLEET